MRYQHDGAKFQFGNELLKVAGIVFTPIRRRSGPLAVTVSAKMQCQRAHPGPRARAELVPNVRVPIAAVQQYDCFRDRFAAQTLLAIRIPFQIAELKTVDLDHAFLRSCHVGPNSSVNSLGISCPILLAEFFLEDLARSALWQ